MKQAKMKILSVTAKDLRWDYYRGTGAGGQKRNKTENCVRCTHVASGAVGKSEEGRSKGKNKQKAFSRMAKSERFQKWVRIESMRRVGQLNKIEESVDRSMVFQTRLEYREESGKWKFSKELQITWQDIANIKE